jgi:riboflavin kinase/FMN adenylyltransferase
LCRFRDKYSLLAKLGVKRFICVNFTYEFAEQSAKDFIENLLVNKLGIKHLIIGDDFHFGKNRLGDFAMLKTAGEQYNFQVTDTKSYKVADCRISSTAIRQALQQDKFEDVKRMLGREYSIDGRVFHGDKRGRQLGFPTANVLLKRKVSPITGVFAVKVKTPYGQFNGVANIGARPTVLGTRQQLEVHLFDFDQDLYGQRITVIIKKKLRPVQKFDSLEALTAQISKDSAQAKSTLLA